MEYIYLNILGCVRAGTSGWQLETWFLPRCGCFIKLEIFGLFRCQSHSQIEGSRFPKVLSRFLTFFDLEDFALLGIVFIITLHWSCCLSWFSECWAAQQSIDHTCFSGKLAGVPTSWTTFLPFFCHCMLLSPSLLCSPHDRLMNPRDEVLQQGIRLYSESRLTKKMAD